MSERPIPRATYRLQLNKDFRFIDVAGLAPYLARLGVSHAYLSPILKARAGSTHGYDTVDHSVLNPELGSLQDFRDMATTLRGHGLGIVLDIVPNHMGIGGTENPYWLDVLEWGRKSRFADWFDIDWQPSEPSLKDKVLVPFLGRSFGEAISSNALELRFDEASGSLAIWAEGTHQLPVSPSTYGTVLATAGPECDAIANDLKSARDSGEATTLKRRLVDHIRLAPDALAQVQQAVGRFNEERGREDLARLIEMQHWRPARYSVAADDINYRRFFIVSDLAAIRVERDDVFDHVHRLVFQLIEEGHVDGLRVDHIDGLFDPKAYCLKLRHQAPRPIYLIVEKILAPHERLPPDWETDGTTGYEFGAAVTNLLVDRRAEAEFTDLYRATTGLTAPLATVERDAKLGIIDYEMAAELDSLTTRLHRIAASKPATRDLTRNALRNGLRHVVSSMPIYRSYVTGSGFEPTDRRNVRLAVARARRLSPQMDTAVFDFIEAVMAGLPVIGGGDDVEPVPATAARIQQYTAPVMAKGLEDTALYRFNRLIALCEVGQRPDRFGSSIESFHDFCRSRQRSMPDGMLASSTHDTKRGEDVRARLTALTYEPRAWRQNVERWFAVLGTAAGPPLDPNDVYYFFQSLLGVWPLGFNPQDGGEAPSQLADRLEAAMLKSVREARLHTNWLVPQEAYEDCVRNLVRTSLDPSEGNLFLGHFHAFAESIGVAGAANGLVATALKLTAPGVPDIYQGAELWEQSLVDPDNRRPVDYDLRWRLLDAVGNQDVLDLKDDWSSGAVKLALCERLLHLRSQVPHLFREGSYEPLPVTGADAGRVLAFARRAGKHIMVVAAGLGPLTAPLEAALTLPWPVEGLWKDCLARKNLQSSSSFDVREICSSLPVAVLLNDTTEF